MRVTVAAVPSCRPVGLPVMLTTTGELAVLPELVEIRPTDATVPKIGVWEDPTVSCAWMPGLIRLIELSSTVTFASQLLVETIRNGAVLELPDELDDPELVPDVAPDPPAAPVLPDPEALVPLDPPADALAELELDAELEPETESPTATPTVATKPVIGDFSTASANAARAVMTSARAVTTWA